MVLCLLSFAIRYGRDVFLLGNMAAYPKEVRQALRMSGDNIIELEMVIANYSSFADSLKLKAFWFLLENMPGKYSIASSEADRFDKFFLEVQRFRKSEEFLKDKNHPKNLAYIHRMWSNVYAGLRGYSKDHFIVEPDLLHIKASFLIESIDYAFKAWELPWCRHLNFQEFCEYILPYRLRDERLESWRKEIFERHRSLIDSLVSLHIIDPISVAQVVHKKIGSDWMYSDWIGGYPIALTADNLWQAKIGNCTQQTYFGVFVLRALGVPSCHEQIINYGNRSLGHDFVGVIGRNDEVIDLDFGDTLGGVIDYKIWEGYRVPKVYRDVFSNSEASLSQLEEPFFNLRKKDVTAKYVPVGRLELRPRSIPRGVKHIYLCVFDNSDWKPVDVSEIVDGSAVFLDVGAGVLYMPMYYGQQGLLPAYDPVILDSEKMVNTIDVKAEEINMVLKRKFFKRTIFNQISGMRGSFQGSNRVDFSEVVDLYTIDDSLELYPKYVDLDDMPSFRYIRYSFSGGLNGYLANFEAIGEFGEKLDGEIILDARLAGNETIKNVFDADVLSYAAIDIDRENFWYGLDLRSQVKLKGISFCPRTDKNDIWPGLRYELFYWNDKWNSLGIKLADTNELTFSSPMSGGLFLLRCLDEGQEERIFTYQNDSQIWW